MVGPTSSDLEPMLDPVVPLADDGIEAAGSG